MSVIAKTAPSPKSSSQRPAGLVSATARVRMFASISKLFKKSRRTAAPEQSPFSPAPGELEQAAPVDSNGAEPPEAAGVTDAAGQLAVSYAAILKAVPHNLHGKNASASGST